MLDVYRTYYKMTGEPFRLSPDHRFSLAHSSYANAKAYLQYAIFQGEGFIAVTGGPGTGKTTLISDLVEGLDREHIEVATLTSTQLESRDLLQMVVNLFDLHPEDTSKPGLLQELEQFLNQQSYKGRRVILVVDEAQGLSAAALEELRLLANLQRNHQLLLQIFLVGQEQLLDMLRKPGMEHLHQRLIAASHLQPLGLDEVIDYIEHRLSRVGWKGDPSIDEGALRLIHRYSGGVPRRINLICNRLFLYGGLEQKHALVAEDARTVIDELHKEFLLSPESEDESREPASEPDQGADTPVRSLPRRDMNAAPEPTTDEPARKQKTRKFRRKPAKSGPATEPSRKASRRFGGKKKSPEQVTPAQVSGRKRRIEPTMRREPTIGPARPVTEPEVPAKKGVWGKVATVAVVAGFVWMIYKGDQAFDLAGLFGDSDEARPQVTFNAPLNTEPTVEQPVAVTVPEAPTESADNLVGKTDEGESGPPQQDVVAAANDTGTAGAGHTAETGDQQDEAQSLAPEEEKPADTHQEAVSTPAETRVAKDEAAPDAQAATDTEPLTKAVPGSGDATATEAPLKVATASPEPVVEPVKQESVQVNTAAIEAQKARLQREAELRLAMNLSKKGADRKTARPVKKVSPPAVTRAPKAPVKLATAPPIRTAPTRSPAEVLRAALLEGQWASRGKPASLLPSKVTYCNSQGERIACLSVPQDIKTRYGPALYKVETTLKGFSAGKRFQLSYRTLVKLLESDSAAARESALANDTGWQISEYTMSCTLARPDQVLCRDDKGVTRNYRRSVPATVR
ncbi:MAG TPA: DUF2075 domain-containing protein [Gammaproteobacteria bacterium]|nr:DUF2075 domain-containing protein [Gammaproteobacteria bacterium]